MSELLAPALAGTSLALLVGVVALRHRVLLPVPAADRAAGPGIGPLHRLGSLGPRPRAAVVERIRRRLEAMGAGGSVEEILGASRLAATASGALVLVVRGPIVLVPIAAIAGSRLPEMTLARRARRRRLEADRELPVFLDLVAAAVSAGLTGLLAVRRATEAVEGALATELGAALRRIDLGGRWRDELVAAATRLDLPDLRRAVVVLTRSETIGSSLAEAFSDLARESREARRVGLAERARTAPVKMLFPLVFLVLPAFLLLTVVPVLVATLRSIG